jgi:uncharacterized protein
MPARRANVSRGSHFASSALAVILVLLAARAFAAELKFPPLTGRVVDDAGVLSASTISELDEMLAQHERTTSQQFVVATIGSLQGHSIEDYGYQLGRAWGIGQKGKNNGAILIVAPHEHKVRIEVGYGLEGQLTDAASRVIIENYITPQFRSGDFNAGVLAGTTAVLRALGDDAAANLHPETLPVAEGVDANQTQLSPSTEFMLMIFLLIVMLIVMRRSRHPYLMRHGGGPYMGSGGFGGGSSGGGGFSGGGGSFGGGGASGSW